MLVIGDEALRLVDRGVPYIVDVGELWSRVTGKPLVYAVMVARVGTHTGFINYVINEIEKSLRRFEEDPEEVINYTGSRLGVSRELIREYFRSIRYRVDDEVLEAIETELEILKLPNCLRTMTQETPN
ncbi:MqnA/MqnD/SBP family protein [Vulcanisaeta thermophila]|uniref:MqnA/MqnD/SBP family protein n=1 Tax=Vulcanisaeta thermophila TaxID=867917 RepID=UPI000A6B4AE0|nr:MqnA/MqnD/SBP family protein [Vulcanisaeta thermophila]